MRRGSGSGVVGRTIGADPLHAPILCAVVLTGAFILASADAADPDLWGHVRYGQDVLAQGSLPRTTTHTFTAPNQPWINHEILSELVFGFVALHAGGKGLLVLKAVLGLSVIAAIVRTAAERGASLAVTSVVVLLVSFNLAPGWTVRPQLFGWVAFALVAWLLERDARRHVGDVPDRCLWFAVPIFAVWTNTHGGFIAGLCVFGLYLGMRSVGDVWTCGAVALPVVAQRVLLVAASAAATLINPYGVELLLWLAHDLGPPRPEISEWGALHVDDVRFVAFAALLVSSLAAWAARRERCDHLWGILLLVTAAQSFAHVRHVPFFAILVGYWLPGPLQDLWRRWRPAAEAQTVASPRLRNLRTASWIAVGGLAIALVLRCQTLWVSKAQYPVTAFEYMAAHRLVGRLVAHFDWSQYAIAAFAPATTVAFDGRFRTSYPQDVADMHFDFILGDIPQRWRSPTSPPFDAARALEFGRPDLVLVSRQYQHSVAVMEQRADWVLLYQDALAQIWGRRSEYDDAAQPRYVPPTERSIGNETQSGKVAWPALPGSIARARFSLEHGVRRTAG